MWNAIGNYELIFYTVQSPLSLDVLLVFNDVIGSTSEDVFSSSPIDVMAERELVS